MANEFVHDSVGTTLTQAEFEGVGLHIFNSQATGDILYASSSSQLSRLGIGSTGQPLLVESGIPAWSSALTITNDNTKTTILGKTGDYLRIGDAGTTSNSLASEDDLMIAGKLEVDGVLYADGGITTTSITTSAKVGFSAAGSLTISSGAITVTEVYHTLVVEGGTGSGADQLDSAAGGTEGQMLILKTATSGANDQVTVADGTGAGTFILAGGANFVMDHIDDRIMFIHNGTEWVEISRSSNS